MQGEPRVHPVRALVHSWLVLDFFADARRRGGDASTLTTTIFSQSFLALVFAALLFPEIPPVPYAAANLSLSTLLVALGCFEAEEPAARRQCDRVLLLTAPISRLQAALARGLHASFATMLITIGMALPPAILLACHEQAPLLVPGSLAAACACSALAIGGLSTAMRLLRRLLGGHGAALIAGVGKAALLGVGLAVCALSLQRLKGDADALPIGRLGAELLPTYHAARLLHDPAGEAWRALPWLAAAALLLLANAALGDDERQGRGRARRAGWIGRIERRFGHGPQDAAITAFASALLWRSPGIRARVLPLLGVPTAFAVLALRTADEHGVQLLPAMALQFPAIYLPFVIVMMRQSDQPGGRWIFDTAPPMPLWRVQRAAWLSLLFRLLLPVHAILLPCLWLLGMAPLQGLLLSAWSASLGGIAARLMVRSFDDVPFAHDDAQTDLDLGSLTAFGLALAGLGAAFATAAPALQATAATLAALTLGALLRRREEPA